MCNVDETKSNQVKYETEDDGTAAQKINRQLCKVVIQQTLSLM